MKNEYPITHIHIDTACENGCCSGYCVNSMAEQIPNWLIKNGYPKDSLNEQRSHNQRIAFLTDFYLDEFDRGQGHGSEALEAFIDEAQSLRADHIVLSCDLGESQINDFSLEDFYKDKGFIVIDYVSSSNPLMILTF